MSEKEIDDFQQNAANLISALNTFMLSGQICNDRNAILKLMRFKSWVLTFSEFITSKNPIIN